MRTIIIQRHADALEGPVDADRPLSEVGWAQAKKVQAKLAERGAAYRADVTFSSPARRARETAIADGPNPSQLVILPILYPFGFSPDLDKLFELELPDDSPRTYLKHDPQGLLLSWAKHARVDIADWCIDEGKTDSIVRLVFHAPVATFLALKIVGDRNQASREKLLDLDLGKGACIVIDERKAVEIIEP